MSTDLPYPIGQLRQVHDRGEIWVEDDTGRNYELCAQCNTWFPADLLSIHITTNHLEER